MRMGYPRSQMRMVASSNGFQEKMGRSNDDWEKTKIAKRHAAEVDKK
jgi:hypothetical protein